MDKLKTDLEDFKKKYSNLTSADLQTFIYGWKAGYEYAAEVSREMAAKFACEMNFNERADFRELPEEYYDDYDNWIKQQEEKK